MFNDTLKKLKANPKRYIPAVITTVYVIVTVATVAHYRGKTLLEITENDVNRLRERGGFFVYETSYGDLLLRLDKQK